MQLYYIHTIHGDRATGDDGESRHLQKVMRASVGDLVSVTDGEGHIWTAEILRLSRSGVDFKLLKALPSPAIGSRLAIAVAPTKQASRIEELVQRGVEIGLTDLYLIKTQRTERDDFKTDRIERQSIACMKQCMRADRLRIHSMQPLMTLCKSPLMKSYPHQYVGQLHDNPPPLMEQEVAGDTLIYIGPEGDFTPDEYQSMVSCGIKQITLGPYRLRTETAAMMAAMAVVNKRMIL